MLATDRMPGPHASKTDVPFPAPAPARRGSAIRRTGLACMRHSQTASDSNQ
jgi:hypothetical protein